MFQVMKQMRDAKRKRKRRWSPRNYTTYRALVDQVAEMWSTARQAWIDKETENWVDVPQRQTWKMINKLADPGSRTGIQPVKANGQFVFTDDGIVHEMEKLHVNKYGSMAIPDQASHEIQQWASEAAEECNTDVHYLVRISKVMHE